MRSEHPDWIFMTHEELSRDPIDAFGQLFRHLDVEFSDEIQAWLRSTTGAENPAEAPSGTAHALTRDSRANIRNWTKRLTPDEITRLRSATERVTTVWYGDAAWDD